MWISTGDQIQMRHSALAILLLLAFAVLLSAAAFASVNQNANSSTTTNKNQNERGIAPPQQDFSKNTWELPADADKTKNPVPTSEESVAKGKELYLERTKGNCVFCHGETGSG